MRLWASFLRVSRHSMDEIMMRKQQPEKGFGKRRSCVAELRGKLYFGVLVLSLDKMCFLVSAQGRRKFRVVSCSSQLNFHLIFASVA